MSAYRFEKPGFGIIFWTSGHLSYLAFSDAKARVWLCLSRKEQFDMAIIRRKTNQKQRKHPWLRVLEVTHVSKGIENRNEVGQASLGKAAPLPTEWGASSCRCCNPLPPGTVLGTHRAENVSPVLWAWWWKQPLAPGQGGCGLWGDVQKPNSCSWLTGQAGDKDRAAGLGLEHSPTVGRGNDGAAGELNRG